MEKTLEKRIFNLLVRVGDQGGKHFNKDLEKLIQLSGGFLTQEKSQTYYL